MTLKDFLAEIRKDKHQREILNFFDDRWLGEVIGLDDIYDADEKMDDLLKENSGIFKEFLQVFEAEKKLIGTKDFLADKPGYPKPNYAGFEYPEPAGREFELKVNLKRRSKNERR